MIYRYNPAHLVPGKDGQRQQQQALDDAEAVALPPLSALERALLEPAWKGGNPPGEEGGRPDLARLCTRAPVESTSRNGIHSMSRM